MKTSDLNKFDRFRIVNLRERDPNQTLTVEYINGGHVTCYAKNPRGGEYRFSFSDDYLKDAVIEMVYRAPVVDKAALRRHAIRMADQLLANTPVGEEIRFENAAQEVAV